MNLVPTKATVSIARRMVQGSADNGADVVLEHLRDIKPDQIPALIGVLAKFAAGLPVVVVGLDDIPHTISAAPEWVCSEALHQAAVTYGILPSEMLTGRADHITRARQVAMAAAAFAGVSYAEIGRQYYRHHTTCMSADRYVQRTPELWTVARAIGGRLTMPRMGTAS